MPPSAAEAPPAPGDPDLGRFHAEFERAKAEAAALLAGLDQAAFQWRPAPERWSLAQVLDHLIVLGARYMATIDDGIALGRLRGWHGRGPFRYPWLQRQFVSRYVEPPPRVRVRTLRAFQPAPERALDGTLEQFVRLQEDFQRRLARAEGLDLRRIRVPSPPTRLFRISLGMAFAYMSAHQRRHFWQARDVRAQSRLGP